MRVISGIARGTKLYTLNGIKTRPTLDRIKESLFNIITLKVKDSNVLDLFSGSGALAIEALSRGASYAVLCDFSKDAIEIINKNIEKTRLNKKSTIKKMDYKKCLQMLETSNSKFDIIFLDPPYDTDYIYKATKLILEYELLNENGIIIAETDDLDRILSEINSLDINVKDIRKFGRVKLLFLEES